jgi:UrcA family protein
MSNFVSRIAGVATLALATLPIVGLAFSAHAGPAPVRIQVSDLDLNSPVGLAQFKQRALAAEKQFCGGARSLSASSYCRMGVRDEIADKLANAQRAQLASRGALASR